MLGRRNTEACGAVLPLDEFVTRHPVRSPKSDNSICFFRSQKLIVNTSSLRFFSCVVHPFLITVYITKRLNWEIARMLKQSCEIIPHVSVNPPSTDVENNRTGGQAGLVPSYDTVVLLVGLKRTSKRAIPV